MNYFSDSSEWRYLVRHNIDWDNIIPLYYPSFPTAEGFKDKEEVISFCEEMLTATGKWSAESIAKRARELDEVGGGKLVDGHVEVTEPLQKTYEEAKEQGVFGLCIDSKFGGIGAPTVVGLLAFEQMSRACVATASQIAFFSGIADMIERYCGPEIQEKYMAMIANGEISGSMCMTEPDAGSDVGALRTSAEKNPDGTYRLNGTKCFITNGGGGLGFVLARVKGAPAGLEGISIFFVEEWLTDSKTGQKKANYKIGKIEDKMGMHGSPTCEVIYENAIGTLVGEENSGFKIMLFLMNAARISVGLQGLGSLEGSLALVQDYCQTRKQFGKPINELPLMKRNIQDWETEKDAFRVLMVDTVSHFDIFQRLDLKKRQTGDLDANETHLFKKSSKVVRKRTPLVKYYGAEIGATITQKAIQAFGGYGFMKDYDAERLHRDSFGALLYEGTSQIQALMAMKDLIKSMTKNPTRFIQTMVSNHPISSWIGTSEFTREVRVLDYEFRKNVASLFLKCVLPDFNVSDTGVIDKILQFNKALKSAIFDPAYWNQPNRFDKLMAHAETLCAAMSYLETIKVLARSATQDPSRGDLYRRYLRLVRPRLDGVYSDWSL